jgi:glyoxylase-like metal-dependent hydrolase (beta-lactamase superfamily II)
VALQIQRLTLAHLRGVDGLTWPVHGFVVRFPGGAALVDTGAGGPQRWLDDWRVVNRSVADALEKHAAFYVQRAELERARVESPKLTDWFDFMNARFELVDGDAEVLPGLRLVATPGHTVGHQSVLVDSADGQSDVLVGDAAYTPRQYLDPASDDLPDGQASDVNAWRASVGRIRSAAPDRVHFCHDTEIIHS